MKIKKLKLKNIRSYESAEIEFPEGSLLLSGDIGSGKTSILLAIEYALFGLQPGQKGSALLRNNAQFAEVNLELEIDGNEIIIERRLKRETKSISNDYSAITINGEKIESSVTELKTKILSLLQYPSEFLKKNNLLYRYTVYTPQEQMKQIILEEPETRLNLLGHVFGIAKYKRIRENLTILLNKLKEDSKFLQLGIRELDNEKEKLKLTQQFILDLQEKIGKQDFKLTENISKRKMAEKVLSELEEKIKEKEKFEKELEKTNISLTYKKESIINLEKELKNLQKIVLEQDNSFNEDKLKAIIKNLIEKKEEIEKLNSKYIDIFSRLKSLEQERAKLLEKKERVFKIEICPTCLQNVPYAHKHNIMNETENQLVDASKKILDLEEEKKKSKDFLDKLKAEIPKIEEEKTKLEILKSKIHSIEKSKQRLIEIEKEKKTLDNDIILLNSHMNGMKESILEYSKFQNFIKTAKEDLNNAQRQEKLSEISLAELKKELELTNKEIINVKKSIEEKEGLKKKLTDLLELNDWLSNNFIGVVNFMERNVMMKLRVEFSRLFNKWFQTLAGDSFEVKLDENFTPLILQGEIEMDYAFLSGGERTAVALAYRLALNQTINSILSNIKTKDIIILDEPTEGFSELQLDKMRDVLVDLKIPQLIIVSHEQKIEGFVETVIRLKKEGFISNIENNLNPETTKKE